MILAGTVLPAKDIHTARHTIMLQITPRSRASPKVRPTFPEATVIMVSSRAPSTWEGVWLYTTRRARMMLPAKFPRYTNTQFFSTPENFTSFSRNGMTRRQLPVKSSLPAISTRARPAGNMQAPTSFPRLPPMVAVAV